MSHISHFEDQERQDAAKNGNEGANFGENARNGASIWDFYAGGGKTPNAKFLSRFRPYSRRISFQAQDLQIDLEDEEHNEEIERK